MSHTPTPWRVEPMVNRDRIRGPQNESIAETGAWLPAKVAEMHANAAFIVQACNSFEALVEALKRIEMESLLTADYPAHMQIIFNEAKAALAKVQP